MLSNYPAHSSDSVEFRSIELWGLEPILFFS